MYPARKHKSMKKLLFSILAVSVLVACGGNSKQREKDAYKKEQAEAVKGLNNGLFFRRIDNIVRVFVNDKMVFESEDFGGRENVKITFDLDPFISSDNDVLRLELHNGECGDCDTNWQILLYELFKNGEMVDYYHENRASMDKIGNVWEIEYVWGELVN